MKRTPEQAEETRQALIKAGIKLFGAHGYAQTSLASICKEAGTTKGALFHHFPGKEGLFRAVWAELQVQMDAEAGQAAVLARSRTDPYAGFLAGCKTYIEWVGRPYFQQIVLIDGPAVLGADWYEQDDALGHKNVLAGVKYLTKMGLVEEHRAEPYAYLLQHALNGAGYAISRQAEGVTSETLFEAFEVLVRNAR